MINKNILKRKIVLYVEDDENTKEEVSFFLEKFIGKLYTASNGKEGLKLFKKYSPDIIITDIQMPIMNGIDMVKEIKKINTHIPIVVTTAFNETKYLIDAINNGVNRYILKPINMKKMIEELIELLDEVECQVLSQTLDSNGNILTASQECLDFFGYSLSEIVGKNALDFMDKKSAEEVKYNIVHSKNHHKNKNSLKVKIKHKDGSKIEVVIYAMFRYTEDGNLDEIDVEFKNINAFSRSQTRLEKVIEKERYLRGMISIYAQIASATTRADSLEEFLQNVSNAFIQNSEYEHVFFTMLKDENTLEIRAQSKHEILDIKELLGKSFKISDNIYFPIKEALNTNNMLIIDDISKLIDFPAYQYFENLGINIKTIVSLPVRLKAQNACLGFLTLHFNKTPKFSKEELELFESISETIAFAIHAFRDKKEKETLIKILDFQATTDILTGCTNRFKGSDIGKKEIERSLRYKRNLSILYFDIDYFKNINDTLGHDQGDIVLRKSTQLAQELVRTSDIIVRWGGEEFIVILPETKLTSAIKIAEKLRRGFEEANFIENRVVTASFGVVELMENENWDALVKRADDLMYKAKRSGRNRVINA